MNVEWSHPDRPGERYTLVSVDYGAYANLKGTQRAPDEALFWEVDKDYGFDLPEDLVPLKTDRRSIRRIVVSLDDLNKLHKP